MRPGLKEYSDWPTYPQLYVKGELVGVRHHPRDGRRREPEGDADGGGVGVARRAAVAREAFPVVLFAWDKRLARGRARYDRYTPERLPLTIGLPPVSRGALHRAQHAPRPLRRSSARRLAGSARRSHLRRRLRRERHEHGALGVRPEAAAFRKKIFAPRGRAPDIVHLASAQRAASFPSRRTPMPRLAKLRVHHNLVHRRDHAPVRRGARAADERLAVGVAVAGEQVDRGRDAPGKRRAGTASPSPSPSPSRRANAPTTTPSRAEKTARSRAACAASPARPATADASAGSMASASEEKARPGGGRARGARRGRGAPRSASPRVASQGYTRRGGRAGGRRRRHRETLRHRAQGTVKSATRSELGFRFWFAGGISTAPVIRTARAPLHRCGDAVARPGQAGRRGG